MTKHQAIAEFELSWRNCVSTLAMLNTTEAIVGTMEGLIDALENYDNVRRMFGVQGCRLDTDEWITIGKFLFFLRGATSARFMKKVMESLPEEPRLVVAMLLQAMTALALGANKDELIVTLRKTALQFGKVPIKGVM
jgi:hypothetical protein